MGIEDTEQPIYGRIPRAYQLLSFYRSCIRVVVILLFQFSHTLTRERRPFGKIYIGAFSVILRASSAWATAPT